MTKKDQKENDGRTKRGKREGKDAPPFRPAICPGEVMPTVLKIGAR